MEDLPKILLSDNPAFNQWLDENYPINIEGVDINASEVFYTLKYEGYIEALDVYNEDPQLVINRIVANFPTPVAFYFEQAENNYDNAHHRLDLLKSCWEAIIFLVYGLVVGEARYRKIPLGKIGLFKFSTFISDRLYDKLTIVENILDHINKKGILFNCANIISAEVLGDIKQLNQERNGFAHTAAKTTKQQEVLYSELYPLLCNVLKKLIGLEKVKLLRYHDTESPLYPRCEVYCGSSLSGKKEIIILNKTNYTNVLDEFGRNAIFAQIDSGDIFCLTPFVHFYQEDHEANAYICFFKKKANKKYTYEVTSKSITKTFAITEFTYSETELKTLIDIKD